MAGAKTRSARAFRPGTVANQDSHVLLFVAFALYFRLNDFPATARVLLAFAEFLLRTYNAPKSALNALSSVRRFHLDYRFQVDAFDDVLLERWKRSLPLTVRRATIQAAALPLGVLEQLCDLAFSMGREGKTMAAFLAVCFHSFARASTLLTGSARAYDTSRLPTLADVERSNNGFTLTIKWDKTHQHVSQAFQVPLLPRPGSPACPVGALDALLARGRDSPAYGPLFATPVGHNGRVQRVPLTITQARSWLRVLLRLANLDQAEFSLHSLRRGGCTFAYAGGAGVTELQSLGGWRSAAVHLYHSQADARRRAAVALVARQHSPSHHTAT